MTRFTFFSSSMSGALVWSRPAVSHRTTSAFSLDAALHRLEADARRVGALLAAHDRRADALRPDLELLAGGGAEGVARAEQDRVPAAP